MSGACIKASYVSAARLTTQFVMKLSSILFCDAISDFAQRHAVLLVELMRGVSFRNTNLPMTFGSEVAAGSDRMPQEHM